MRILITGAQGFIGSHLLRSLHADGHQILACVRRLPPEHQAMTGVRYIEVNFRRNHKSQDWLAHLQGVDVVINAIGIIRESGGNTFEDLHSKTPRDLFSACEQAGVGRVVQISALGTERDALSSYHRSKWVADEYLMTTNLCWGIFMPSIVYGPGAKSMDLFKGMAALPFIPLLGRGEQPIQPIHVDDLVAVIKKWLLDEQASRLRMEVPGPVPITMRELYGKLRQWLGYSRARFVAVPYPLALLAARVSAMMSHMPVSAETLAMLQRGSIGDVKPLQDSFGITPRSLTQSLRESPACLADRWQAGLYFLRPLLRVSIALLWIFTGIVSAFFFPVEKSYALLAALGVQGVALPLLLYGAAALDLALGVATLFRWRIVQVGALQIAVMIFYTLLISVYLGEQWLEPFGPISKNLPIIAATLIMMVLERR